MKLQELLKNIQPVQIIGDAEVEVSGINIDSRKIKEGHLFVAMKGTQVDGHKFIPKAIELGAKSVLCEDMPEDKTEGVTYIQVESTEDAVGKVATLFYGDPSRKLKLVGVTGTNGKPPSPPYYIICSASSVINVAYSLPYATTSKTKLSLLTILLQTLSS